MNLSNTLNRDNKAQKHEICIYQYQLKFYLFLNVVIVDNIGTIILKRLFIDKIIIWISLFKIV